MKLKATVILCTYNPRKENLERTIEGLRIQSLNQNYWELIIVDNNSTNEFDLDLNLSWHKDSKLITEKEQGVVFARITGMKNATSDIFIFVDDDNILDSNYLYKALEISKNYPFLGAWGGASVGDFEAQPPNWFTKKHFEMLAIRELERDVWSNVYFDKTNPFFSAGLVIRRSVGEKFILDQENQNTQLILGRSGDSLLSGEDNEIVFTAIDLGFGVGCFKELKFTHIITKNRLTKAYIIKLTEAMAISNVLLYYKYGKDYSLPVRPRGIATDILYQLQLWRIPKIKKALMDAELMGILKGKELLKNLN